MSDLLSTFQVPVDDRSPLLRKFECWSELLDCYKKIVNFKSSSTDDDSDDDSSDNEEEVDGTEEETEVSQKPEEKPELDLTALSEIINLVTESKKDDDVIVVEDNNNVILIDAEDGPGR